MPPRRRHSGRTRPTRRRMFHVKHLALAVRPRFLPIRIEPTLPGAPFPYPPGKALKPSLMKKGFTQRRKAREEKTPSTLRSFAILRICARCF
jgi:hypothetical protein